MVRALFILCAALIAPTLHADDVNMLRQQVADLRNQLQQRGDMNSDWLLRQQLRELKSTVAQQEMRIRQLESLVASAGLRERSAGELSSPKDDLAVRLTELCKRTEWGEAVPAATCKQLGVEQAHPGSAR